MNLKTHLMAGAAIGILTLLVFPVSAESALGIGESCFNAIQRAIEVAATHPGTVTH